MDSNRTGRPSLYHVACEVVVSDTREARRCSSCRTHRSNLRVMFSRSRMDDRTDPSSHTNYCRLTSPEKKERLKRLHREVRIMQQKLERLKGIC